MEFGHSHSPRLPPELLRHLITELELPCIYGDPGASSALASLSLTNKSLRHWALQTKHSIVVTPRHVRDFRKWIKRSQQEMIGYTRALFVSLDDVGEHLSRRLKTHMKYLRYLN